MQDSHPCPACGTPIEPRRNPGNPRIWCSEACRLWNHNRRARELRSVRRVPSAERKCQQCDANMPDRSAAAKYCTTRCGEIARGQRLASTLPLSACALPECGITFQPWRTGQRCCSEKHGKLLYNRESRADGRQKQVWTDRRRDNYHRRRARRKAASTGEPVLFADIAERDRWRCHICGTRVGKKIAWPHPRSPSLDHLIPLTELGAHDPTNVRLAHLVCNTAKGNRGGGEQLLLIG